MTAVAADLSCRFPPTASIFLLGGPDGRRRSGSGSIWTPLSASPGRGRPTSGASGGGSGGRRS